VTISKNSIYGNPAFVDASVGDYSVKANSPAFSIGFQNFEMDKFGVKQPHLVAIAQQPDLPVLIINKEGENTFSDRITWMGATLGSIETKEEQSAYGLRKMAGVKIIAIELHSAMADNNFRIGDVIIAINGKEVLNTKELSRIIKTNKKKTNLNVDVVRNQQELIISIEK